jgi:hypothetical protein
VDVLQIPSQKRHALEPARTTYRQLKRRFVDWYVTILVAERWLREVSFSGTVTLSLQLTFVYACVMLMHMRMLLDG